MAASSTARGGARLPRPHPWVSAAQDRREREGADAKLAHWDRTGELASIEVPALVIGAEHDTMDPAHMRMIADRLPQGRYLHCPDGSHLAMYDDQQVYFRGLIDFLRDL